VLKESLAVFMSESSVTQTGGFRAWGVWRPPLPVWGGTLASGARLCQCGAALVLQLEQSLEQT
jgi:hypothetical protein